MADADWTNSIVGFEAEVDAADLVAHPLNARLHPLGQRSALRYSLNRVGWVDAVKVNRRTGRIVDGHARVEEAVEAGASVPVLYVDLDEEQEKYVLATLDPISALATYDSDVLNDLMDELHVESDDILALLALHGLDKDPELSFGNDDEATPDESEFWPTLKFQVDPHNLTAWNERLAASEGDENALFAQLLGTDQADADD
jgi:hypothetical protein